MSRVTLMPGSAAARQTSCALSKASSSSSSWASAESLRASPATRRRTSRLAQRCPGHCQGIDGVRLPPGSATAAVMGEAYARWSRLLFENSHLLLYPINHHIVILQGRKNYNPLTTIIQFL